jgi:hypothetical protein
VQTACRLDDVKTRAQVKMIGVAEDDFSLDIILQVFMIYALDSAHSANWHEYRGLNLSVVGGDDTASGRGIRVVMGLYELHLIHFNLQR